MKQVLTSAGSVVTSSKRFQGPAFLKRNDMYQIEVLARNLQHTTPCYTLHSTLYTLHPTPCTQHPTPKTQNPTPYTQNPKPYTLHLTPYTLHPETRTLKRSTVGASAEARRGAFQPPP